MKRWLAMAISASMLATACSEGPAEDEIADASKLSEELEARALEIEDRADQAVIAVEQEAEEELAALNAEAEADAEEKAEDVADRESSAVSEQEQQ